MLECGPARRASQGAGAQRELGWGHACASSRRSAFARRPRYSINMEQTLAPNLSPSERLTLRHIADGEWHISVLDWVAIQRLKRMELVEERDGITMTTKEGQRGELHKTIWRIANDLRGSVDGWDFKTYVLGMLFYRFISENLTAYLDDLERQAELRYRSTRSWRI